MEVSGIDNNYEYLKSKWCIARTESCNHEPLILQSKSNTFEITRDKDKKKDFAISTKVSFMLPLVSNQLNIACPWQTQQ